MSGSIAVGGINDLEYFFFDAFVEFIEKGLKELIFVFLVLNHLVHGLFLAVQLVEALLRQ